MKYFSRAGIVDVHMRASGASEKFKFLQETNEVISSLNNFFNLGMILGQMHASVLMSWQIHDCNINKYK